MLIRPISIDEIISSIKSFKPYKTPELDGFHLFFFKKFLTNILSAIHTLFSNIFHTETMPSTINQTYILIPKQATSETIIKTDLSTYVTQYTKYSQKSSSIDWDLFSTISLILCKIAFYLIVELLTITLLFKKPSIAFTKETILKLPIWLLSLTWKRHLLKLSGLWLGICYMLLISLQNSQT